MVYYTSEKIFTSKNILLSMCALYPTVKTGSKLLNPEHVFDRWEAKKK